MSHDEKVRRRSMAVAAIRRAHASEGGDGSVTLFVSHHLDQIDEGFWLKHTGTRRPKPEKVLEMLVLQSHWSDEDDDGIDNFDFTLPDGVTNYIVTVSFDEDGEVSDIAMES